MQLLSVRNLNVTYRLRDRQVYALRNVNLSIEPGLSLGVVGESGSGKSTLALALLRLLPKGTLVSGEAILSGDDLLSLPEERLRAIRWEKLSVVFQNNMSALSPVHRIGHQLQDVYRLHRRDAAPEMAKARVIELLGKVGLSPHVYRAYPHELSGGMMQRVSIAMSLLFTPSLLILDEATTALDVITQGQILDEIERLSLEFHLTRLLITHDVSIVYRYCPRIAVLYAGQVMETGDTERILNRPSHPYTKGLLEALPTLDGPKEAPRSILGTLPDLTADHPGCLFAPRCPLAAPRCETETPPLVPKEDGRAVACFAVSRTGGERA